MSNFAEWVLRLYICLGCCERGSLLASFVQYCKVDAKERERRAVAKTATVLYLFISMEGKVSLGGNK
jgi:hypothetical protein